MNHLRFCYIRRSRRRAVTATSSGVIKNLLRELQFRAIPTTDDGVLSSKNENGAQFFRQFSIR